MKGFGRRERLGDQAGAVERANEPASEPQVRVFAQRGVGSPWGPDPSPASLRLLINSTKPEAAKKFAGILEE